MSLSQKIVAALDAQPDVGVLPCDVAVTDRGHRLTLRLTSSGPVGLAFDSLDFATDVRSHWSPEAIKTWGDRLAARVTYLMEPLVVQEQDELGGEVEIRSHAPTVRGDQRSYYQVRLGQPGAAHLSRVTFDESTRRRRPTPCQMTREVLERLVDDLITTIP
jgi:hypothetical protein